MITIIVILVVILVLVIIWKIYEYIFDTKINFEEIKEFGHFFKIIFRKPEKIIKIKCTDDFNDILNKLMYVQNSSKIKNSIIINGEVFENIEGSSIKVIDNKIYVDNELIKDNLKGIVEIKFIGDIADLECTNATIHGNCQGDVHSTNLTCINIEGSIETNNITCKDIGGDVTADNVTCNNVEGYVEADKVTAHDIAGNVESNNVICNNIEGDVDAENVKCQKINGSVTADKVVFN